jgi:hypothetical protein
MLGVPEPRMLAHSAQGWVLSAWWRSVLPDGSIIRADPDHEPGLLWVVRGAGDGVGIVIEVEIDAMHVGQIGVAEIILEADREGRILRRWSECLAAAPYALTPTASCFRTGTGRFPAHPRRRQRRCGHRPLTRRAAS